MKKIGSMLFIILALTATAGFSKTDSTISKQKIRTFINLLDYIGKDYPNAVQDGKIINEFEYKEMADFGRQIATLYEQLRSEVNQPAFADLSSDISRLQEMIDEKAAAGQVAELTSRIRGQILKLGLVKVTPQRWPNLAKGKQIFEKRCQSCHGADGFGNGPLAEQLNPTPTNFHDSANADKLSPLQAYNTIRLGLEGTAMRSFSELSDEQVWDVAFYINSLNYKTPVPDSVQTKIKSALADTTSLRSVSLYTNQQWKDLFQSLNIDTKEGMSVVRGLKNDPSAAPSQNSLGKALALLKRSQASYVIKDYAEARRYALDAYLEGVEPEESQIRAADPQLVKKVENKMLAVRSAVKDRVDAPQFKATVASASLAIREAQDLLNNQEYSFWLNFLLAASILLREGLEAFLIIMVILSVLRSVDAGRTVKYVHGGWVVALLAGIGGWFVMQSFIQMSSMQRELMEGLGAFVAVAMLLYIGFWMHSKTHAHQWTRFIKEKVQGLLNKESIWGLAALSFIVVFREAFESIIFLSSISLKSSGSSNGGIFLALIAVAVIITGIGYAYKKFAKSIPIRQLFRYSSVMLSVLALILIGKGVRSLQEAGYIDIGSLAVNWSLPTLGIYATWPTLLAQLATFTIIMGLWLYSNQLATMQKLEGS